MIDPHVLQVPMKPGLELVAVVGTDRADTERKPSTDEIDELDAVVLGVTTVDFQGTNARGVIDGRELIALDLAREGKKLDIDLHVVSRYLLFISFTTCLAMMVRLLTVLGSRWRPCRERMPRTPPLEISTPW